LGNTDPKKSPDNTSKKNRVTIDSKNATTWFFVRLEKNIEMLILKAIYNNIPIYPTIISGRYNELTNDKTIGKRSVRTIPIKDTVKRAKNFDMTTCISETGKVKRTSSVLVRFSSDIILILNAGAKISKNQGISKKNGSIEADPTTNISLIKKKLENTANKITIIYPIGLLR
jgi:hypothetical protein